MRPATIDERPSGVHPLDASLASFALAGSVTEAMHCCSACTHAAWFGAVAAGLDHVHSRDVIHRDLKPENLLLREASVEEASDAPPDVVIADFGLSKEVGQVSGEDSPLARNHTTGVGTASYAHTLMRVRSMSEDALWTRMTKIEKAKGRHAVTKMRLFARVAYLERLYDLADACKDALERLVDALGDPKDDETTDAPAPDLGPAVDDA